MSSSSTRLSTPQGPGSVSGAPNLPTAFTVTFTSRYIDTGALRQHAVIGGDGPPLLLVHGWPENWYAWRLVMPVLARDFTVIAVDQRGIGLTDKPQDGYDTGTLAGDLVALMEALGRYEFAIQGGKPLPEDALLYYFRLFSDPEVLRGSFGFYRAWGTTLAQNEQRKSRPLTMPVLAIGGAESWGEAVGNAMKPAPTTCRP